VIRRAALPFLVAFGLANAGLAWWVGARGLDRRPVDIQSRALWELRLDQVGRDPGREPVVFLGDSLVYGGKLAETHGSDWPRHALPAAFGRALEARTPGRYAVTNLAVNGVLPRDLRRMVLDVVPARPALLVVDVSPRSFSADFETQTSARPFLHDDPDGPAALLLDRVGDGLRRVLPALRYRDLLHFHYLGTTPTEWVEERVRAAFAPEPDPEDDLLRTEILPRMKAAQRLNSVAISPEHAQVVYLERLLEALGAPDAPPAVVFYLQEDLDTLGPQLDRPRYEAQSARLVALVRERLPDSPRLRFVTIDSEGLADQYDDHVHLTAAGYVRLAARLLDDAEAVMGPDAR